MQILVLTFEYPPAQIGGLGIIVQDIYKEIWKNFGNADKKIYVSLAMPSQGLQNGYKNISIVKKETDFDVELGDRKQHIEVKLASDSANPNLPIHLICGAELDDWQCYASLPQKIALFSRAIPMFIDHLFWNHYDVDVIHINDWHCVPAGVMGKLKYAKQGKKIPMLYTIHRIGEKECVYDVHFLDWLKFYEYDNISKMAYVSGFGWGKFSIEALGYYYADKINTVSKRYISDVLNFMGKFPQNQQDIKNKTTYIFNGIEKFHNFNVSEKKTVRKNFLNKNNLSNGILISFVGRFDGRQGKPGALLNAIEKFFEKSDSITKDVRFIIKYSGGDENLLNYANYLQSKFPDNVKILKEWIDLENLYKASDIFVNVPYFEPFGLTTLEAMDSGAIVIGTEVGGVKDMLNDFYLKWDFADEIKNNNVTGFFTLNDATALANKILEVCILVKSEEILSDFGVYSEQYKKFMDSIPTEYGKLKEEILKEPFLAGMIMHNSMARAKKFSVEDTAKRYVEIYKRLCSI
ncbi:MAG: glycogen/starch synthase [Candidatus Altarchaeum sp.]|nr:glycogen/starch synthase [Candidatus Altarchaeum sp.]